MTAIRKRLATLESRWPVLLPVVVVALGLGLRLWRLGEQSFWYDEAQTLSVANSPFAEIIRRAYRPPLYHYLLHWWGRLVPPSELWLRLPSALFGAAVPLLVYMVAVRLYDRRTAFSAATLAAISPTLIWYSQELRMYSLMAAQFLLALYLALKVVTERGQEQMGLWVGLFLTEAAALYTHYFAIPFIGWLALLTAIVLVVERRWRSLRAWVGLQVAAGLAFVPWLVVVRGGRGGAEDYLAAEVLPVVTTVPGIGDFVKQSWYFYTAGALAPPHELAGVLAVVAALGLGATLLIMLVRALVARRAALHGKDVEAAPQGGRSILSDLYLLGLVAGPVITAIVMYKLRPGVVHPRHLMMVGGPFLILVARAWWAAPHPNPDGGAGGTFALSLAQRVAGVVTGLSLAGVLVVGLALLYHDSSYQRPNVRSLARYVETITAANDMVLLPYWDYPFDHYFDGTAPVYNLETRVGDEPLAGWLLPRAQDSRRAVLLRWVHVYADPRDFLPWLLQNNGRLQRRFWQAERWVSVYDLSSPFVMPPLTPLDVRVDPLALRGVHLPQAVPADQPVAVALSWEITAPATVDYKVSVRAIDPGGNVIASDDRVLLGERTAAGTSHWATGTPSRNYYFLELPPGTPPTSYTVAVSVYYDQTPLDILSPQGAAMGTVHSLGSFRVERPAAFPDRFPPSAVRAEVGRELAPGLMLEGFSVDRQSLRNGEPLAVTLYWKATTAPLPAYEPVLRLVSPSGDLVGEQKGPPAYGQYPCDRWQKGELVIDRRQVVVRPEAEPGQARITLAIEGGDPISLQPVTIEPTDRQFVFPEIQHPLDVTLGNVARLRGFALEKQTVKHGEPLSLILYWQAINEQAVGKSYAVFTHLLNPQEQVIAQHDGLPASGNWPTTGWVRGQAIIDEHELTFKEGIYQGEALLEVGLYDSQSFQRLATPSGQDRIILPVTVTVTD